MRRIRSVSLTIPCVIGSYAGVHCRLELLSSTIRIDSSIPECATRCNTSCSGEDCRYKMQGLSDARFVKEFGVCESIATSSDKATLVSLNSPSTTSDLPFEFSGAVSHWRIELPQDNNQFELDTLTDVVMTLNYTSRDEASISAAPPTKLPNAIFLERAGGSSISDMSFQMHGTCSKTLFSQHPGKIAIRPWIIRRVI
jgi:hypothetical protein